MSMRAVQLRCNHFSFMSSLTLHLGLVVLGIPQQQGGGLAVERVGRVRIAQELREEHLEDVDHVVHGRPGLVDDIEADGAGAFFCFRLC